MTLKVAGLWIYPIKSLPGIRLDTLTFDPLGPRFDRRFMLVDEKGQFITQRQFPALVLLNVSIKDGLLRVDAEAETLTLPKEGKEGSLLKSTIWRDDLVLVDQGDEAAAFFSRVLKNPVRLVHQPVTNGRRVDPDYSRKARQVSLADGFPLLLVNQSSIDEINRKTHLSLEADRFRPNLLIQGAPPFAEDTWKTFSAGDQVFQVVKPCSRCVIPTINPVTSKREPAVWQALEESCLREDGNIYFGQNLLHESHTPVHSNDPVRVIETLQDKRRPWL